VQFIEYTNSKKSAIRLEILFGVMLVAFEVDYVASSYIISFVLRAFSVLVIVYVKPMSFLIISRNQGTGKCLCV
jgi:hypothetical protein